MIVLCWLKIVLIDFEDRSNRATITAHFEANQNDFISA